MAGKSPEQHDLRGMDIFDMIIHGRRFGSNGHETERSMWDRFPKLREIEKKGKFPQNVFIIPDGNRRWAKKLGLDDAAGHEKGSEVIVQAFNDLSELSDHIPFVGAWGLSIDNLNRPRNEVNYLMGLFKRTIEKLRPDILKRGDRFIRIGREDVFDGYPAVREVLEETERETKQNSGQVIYVAVGFSGEDQEFRMMQEFANRIKRTPEVSINPNFLRSFRDGNGLIPPADLVIRTSGEKRLSDLGWIAGKGTELYFTSKLFPNCGTGDFVKALVDFSKRDRRLGKRPATS